MTITLECPVTDQQTTRTIKKVWKSEPTLEGAGVHLKRAFGFQNPQLFDPFLLLDDFRSDTPADYLAGFPWHPHRGMETITYVLDGVVEHQDSLGHGGQIGSGDVQWMTAGSGILHQEMPKGSNSGRMYGFQLWANLPASQKMMDPRYRDVRHDTVPLINNGDGAEIRLIAGRVGEIDGPVQDIVTEPEYMDISLKPGTEFVRQVDPRHTVFAYVVDGEGYFEPGRDATHANKATLHGNGSLVLYGPGDSIRVTAEHNRVRFLLATGKPIGEPIAWGGPIVMNTREELRTAFEDLDKGTFIKVRG
jgi:redox-sensitive bicupin YhaK (pirin superfamily)